MRLQPAIQPAFILTALKVLGKFCTITKTSPYSLEDICSHSQLSSSEIRLVQ